MSSPKDEARVDTAARTRMDDTAVGPETIGSLAPPPRPPSPAEDDDALAATRYEIGALIGRGGMGEVRIARDTHVGRDVAIKVLRGDGPQRADVRARFVREARVQGRLEHPAIVPVYDLGLGRDGLPYLVMKRLTGLTLAEILARAPSEPAIAATWPRRALLDRLVDVCQAIEFAHQRGVIHRDLKPQNIMLGDLGEVYVLDWGIARIAHDDAEPEELDKRRQLESLDDAHQTQTGALLGTLGYMPPEQLRGEVVDRRGDVYALGCVLFELLAGSPALPHGPAALAATLDATAHSPRARAPEVDTPPELDALCVAATAPDRTDRLATAGALAAGLQRYLDGDRDLAHRRALADGYAATATAAVAEPGDDARARAMKQAGRALALDPAHEQAQGVVSRLLFELPSQIPAAVEAALHDHRDTTGRLHFRTAALTYASYFLFLPLLAFVHVRSWWPLLAVFTAIVVNSSLLLAIARRPHPRQLWLYVVLVVQGLQLVFTGMLASPPLILPAMAVTSLSAFLANPRVRSATPIVVVHLLAIAVPVALELLDWMPRTFRLDGETLAISPSAVEFPASWLLFVVLAAATSHLIATSVMVGRLRRAEEAAQQKIQLHTWHLDQLISVARGDDPGA